MIFGDIRGSGVVQAFFLSLYRYKLFFPNISWTGGASKLLLLKIKHMKKNYVPNPVELYHAEIIRAFHDYRKTITTDPDIELNGLTLNNLLAQAKRSTYSKMKQYQEDAKANNH